MWEKRACDGGGGEDGEVCRVMVVCDDGMCVMVGCRVRGGQMGGEQKRW